MFEGSKSAGVRKFVHLGMHNLAGVKLRTFQTRNFQTVNLSNSRTFELDYVTASNSNFKLLPRSSSIGLRRLKLETLKVSTFEGSTALQVRTFEKSKV